ncbi:septum site-determining protein MinC [Herbivorax sp. ANBcel31]|uniref:septum site-determining protein MinC n=1 Tax=Herbivorax sp. ANBcel31 TaxID=3069754 RepID=UPI0027B616F2|nr:septum site-determining protein MinC [Herbivorax sp. ANBcel31]MDQ2086273.1 septum site-determining protein MinC [Herbivorax sp. ANBcel31]
MSDSSVIFKGSLDSLIIIMNEEEDFETVLKGVEDKISSSGKFFKGVNLKVKYRGKKLSKEEENKVFELLKNKSGAEIKSFEEDTQEYVQIEKKSSPKPHSKIKMSNFYFKGLEEGITKFHKGTVRSGQLVRFDGNIVVIGDVNPGGEVIATGNAVVMGSLRGIVHAGSNGNKEAIVVSLNLQPTQLRIADVITRSPDDKQVENQFIPEMAYIKDDFVYIDRYLPSRG